MRGLLTALVAVLLELLIVIGSGNQWVSQRVADKAGSTSLGDVLARASNGFGWRFAPLKGASTLWRAQLAGIGTLIVLTFLLVLVLNFRASRSFFGTVFGIWGIVVLASVTGAVVREVVGFDYLHRGTASAGGRFADSLGAAITYAPVLFGVASGLLAGLITAIVAVATARRIEPVIVTSEPDAEQQPDLWTPETAAPWQNESSFYPPIYPDSETAAQQRTPVEFGKTQERIVDNGERDDADRTSVIAHSGVARPGSSAPDDSPDFDDELSPAPVRAEDELSQPTARAY